MNTPQSPQQSPSPPDYSPTEVGLGDHVGPVKLRIQHLLIPAIALFPLSSPTQQNSLCVWMLCCTVCFQTVGVILVNHINVLYQY